MTRLYDNLLGGAACLHANGDNEGRAPSLVRWRREGPPGANAWFTDSNLQQAREVQAECKVAWLLEPRELRSDPYDYVERHGGDFDFVLSYDGEFLRQQKAGLLPYFFGGTRINPRDWSISYGKRDLVSIVASPKRSMPGHRLRHDVIGRTKVDAFGPEYTPIKSKRAALAPYYFTVAIENCRRNWWFTEALLDPFLTGTVPVYWGCPDIGKIFDARGIIQVENLVDVRDAVASLTPALYDSMWPAIEANFRRAQSYQLTEDWLQRNYPNLFDEVAE